MYSESSTAASWSVSMPITSQVEDPTIPSATNLFFFWNLITANFVPAPNIPSAVNPKDSCNFLTSDPLDPCFSKIFTFFK